MKGTPGKSTSRDDQENKAPENDKPKTGKFKLIADVVIERRGPKKVVIKETPGEKDSENDENTEDESETRDEVRQSGDKTVPEWRRNAPKSGVRRFEKNELPFKDVPPVVAVPSGITRSIEKKVRFDQPDRREEPNFRRRAPVEENLSFEKVTKSVLKQPITLSLGELAGVAPGLRESLRSNFTRKRIVSEVYNVSNLPGNPYDEDDEFEIGENMDEEELITLPIPTVTVNMTKGIGVPIGGLIVSDPISQYLETIGEEDRKRIIVAKDTESLRAVWPEINNNGRDECIVDWGSQIVAMSKDVAINLGLSWDPAFRINMQSANGQVELSEGLAKNIPFKFGDVTAYLQVHVLDGVAYRVLLGRPFEVLTLTKTEALGNGGQLLTITDPNTGSKVVVPTCERGRGPNSKANSEKSENSVKSEDFH